jgi:hypothetical protein
MDVHLMGVVCVEVFGFFNLVFGEKYSFASGVGLTYPRITPGNGAQPEDP